MTENKQIMCHISIMSEKRSREVIEPTQGIRHKEVAAKVNRKNHEITCNHLWMNIDLITKNCQNKTTFLLQEIFFVV